MKQREITPRSVKDPSIFFCKPAIKSLQRLSEPLQFWMEMPLLRFGSKFVAFVD